MEVKELKETRKPLESLVVHLEDGQGIGFKDEDGQFKIVVMDGDKMRKKRISKRHLS